MTKWYIRSLSRATVKFKLKYFDPAILIQADNCTSNMPSVKCCQYKFIFCNTFLTENGEK